MPIGKKIRIYDLARDLKQDVKRVIEDLRREGADVSVPSNSVSLEIAEKIKLRYFPKTEVAPKRGIKIIKASKKEAASELELAQPVEEAESSLPAIEEMPQAPTAQEQVEPAAPAVSVRKILKKKLEAAPSAEAPIAVQPVA
ncbi:MAG: translation initiation factor IF-2 N-terminal domain-containing protein, partial [Acidobacteria bacterium]|nr:translation initiation factor IF-2 N-terminal domain-containing protein [Acidobacteriota bacterium]